MTRLHGLLAAALLPAGCKDSRTLEISIAGDGTTSPAAGAHVYPKGTAVLAWVFVDLARRRRR